MAALAGVLLILLLLLQLAGHGYAVSPPPGSVTIVGSSFNGDGCPSGSSVVVVLSEDAEILTVWFGDYAASSDSPASDQRKQCTVSVQLSYPQGFTFTFVDVILNGYAQLDAGVKAIARTSYYFSTLLGTGRATHQFQGPMDDDFEVRASFVSPASSRCNMIRDLNINSEVRVNAGNYVPRRRGLITGDSDDLKFTQILAFSWEAC
ncbi:hypothetical protein CBR_g23887 [Chara braunii]|uniref:DUF4360 domain-containing protein n=1 Tax=Chara braunii TaxID=69332 RepID=A0A388L5B0_CHABU|nr:hypothetical protein CBR_g23887 [Chara braunii]|eukprot:GBG77438.1 hypothetical protein CBR_g23887 [Chara braunii]